MSERKRRNGKPIEKLSYFAEVFLRTQQMPNGSKRMREGVLSDSAEAARTTRGSMPKHPVTIFRRKSE
jgi:hypothetical protein